MWSAFGAGSHGLRAKVCGWGLPARGLPARFATSAEPMRGASIRCLLMLAAARMVRQVFYGWVGASGRGREAARDGWEEECWRPAWL